MLISKLHHAEPDIDVEQVTLMISDQFPSWARLPLEPVPSSGTDNVMHSPPLPISQPGCLVAIAAVHGGVVKEICPSGRLRAAVREFR